MDLKFIHITKCAGTFIENIGLKYGYKWGRHHTEYGFWHDTPHNKNLEMFKKYEWFMIVRNPYERILSEYYCEWGGIGKKDISHTKEEFNEYIIKKIKRRSLIGGHYTEQYKYLSENICIKIIKLENLACELSELFSEYNINIPSEELNNKTNTKQDKNKLTPFTINDFNDKLVKLINIVYEKDFEYFNYEMKKLNEKYTKYDIYA